MDHNHACGGPEEKRKTYRTAEQKTALLNRLKRLEGQIRGLANQVESDAYCNDILQQSISARSALDGFNQALMEMHLKGCVAEGIREGDGEKVDEFIQTMRKLMK